ncbi:MAG: DNA mismatch repair protein MutS [Hyphomicrobiales bacterium]|nr:DNA mismatch repair protein MutS [Hyphomicrobiales bacterium]
MSVLLQDQAQSQSEVQGGKVTPMMEQFIQIKADNPGSLLFYRMGDFYEMFFEDAQIAAQTLGIALTKRGKYQGNDIPMCGVPVHSSDDYLLKLIRHGHRVAVCEQLENPAEAKKRGAKSVVRRGVVRLVTPGTITEEKLLDPSRSNFLCALARLRTGESSQQLALAWIELSTGKFGTANTSELNLTSDLARIEPSELIMSQNLAEQDFIKENLLGLNIATTQLPGNLFDSASAAKQLCEYFNVQSMDGFGTYSKCELTAAAAILAYVEKTQLAEKPALSHPQSQSSSEVMLIDAATRINLELSKTLSGERQGSLLKAIDRTITGPGARELAVRLMAPLISKPRIVQRLDAVSFLRDDLSLLGQLREYLKSIPDMARAISRLALNRGGPRDMRSLLQGFEVAKQIYDVLCELRDVPFEIEVIRDGLGNSPDELRELLEAALGDDVPILARDGGFVKQGHNGELDELRTLRDASRKIIAGLQANYANQTSVKALKIRHNNVLGYFIEVTANNAPNLQREDLTGLFIHRQTLANAMRFTTTELAELESKIANAAGRALEIELGIFAGLLEKTVGASGAIIGVADAIANLDVTASNAKLAEEQNYCRPEITEDLEFDIRNGRHPVIEQVLQGQTDTPFIANSCNLSPDHNQTQGAIYLLTGPNMGGKSTYLRQNALMVLLAQMGSFVPAEQAVIGIVDRLFSRVGASDDLARGRSTFMVEMVETAAILNQASERSLVILDEIGRGTATFDGLSIAWAAIEHLHEVNCCRTLFATHYHELVALAEPLHRLFNATMKVKEWQGDVVFMHEVIAGAADRSYGIQVAKLAGLPTSVIERARDVLTQLENVDRENCATRIIDDLPLFSVEQKPVQKPADIDTPLVSALAQIFPDELSPREALEKLYALRAMLDKAKPRVT